MYISISSVCCKYENRGMWALFTWWTGYVFLVVAISVERKSIQMCNNLYNRRTNNLRWVLVKVKVGVDTWQSTICIFSQSDICKILYKQWRIYGVCKFMLGVRKWTRYTFHWNGCHVSGNFWVFDNRHPVRELIYELCSPFPLKLRCLVWLKRTNQVCWQRMTVL